MAIHANVEFSFNEQKISAYVFPTIESPLDVFLYILVFPLIFILIFGMTTGELRIDHRVINRKRWNFARIRELTGEDGGNKLAIVINLFEMNAKLKIDNNTIQEKPLNKV